MNSESSDPWREGPVLRIHFSSELLEQTNNYITKIRRLQSRGIVKDIFLWEEETRLMAVSLDKGKNLLLNAIIYLHRLCLPY